MWIKHSAQTLSRLDVLVDQYLDQSDEQKTAWLEQLDQNQPTIAQHLRLLISSEDHLLPARNAAVMPNIEAPNTDDIGLAPTDELPSGTQFGPWKVIRFHTKGGSADIYRGGRADGLFEREVAIKYLRSRAHTSQRRFAREQMLLAKLEHPHIAALLDAGIDGNGVPFLVMPWLPGETFAELDLAKQPLRLRLQWFQQIVSAIEFAHQQLIVHCDLKPSNVMLVNNQAMVLDFGLARLVGAEQLQLTQQAFTPAYASPEQLRGEPVAVATDLHALGLMLFELLSCEPAYPKARLSLANAVNTIVYGEQPKLPRIVGFSRAQQYDAQAIIGQLLAKQPKQRYGNASLLLQDCQRLVERQPISVRKRSLWGRMQAAWIRHQRLAWTAVAGLGVASAYGVQQYNHSQRITFQNQEAQLQSSRTTALLNHFKIVFRENAGTPKTVRQALDESVRNINRYYANDPNAKTELTLALSEFYQRVGDGNAALQLLSPNVKSDASLTQLPPRLQGEMLVRYAELQLEQKNFAEVEFGLAKSRLVFDRNPEVEPEGIWLMTKGLLLIAQGNIKVGLVLRERSTEQILQSRKISNEYKATALHNLAMSFYSNGDLDLAKANFEKASAVYQQENLQDHLRATNVMLARLQVRQGDLKPALATYRDAQNYYHGLGILSKQYAALMLYIARVEGRIGNPEQALKDAQLGYEMEQKLSGPESAGTLNALVTVAENATLVGKRVDKEIQRIDHLLKRAPKFADGGQSDVMALKALQLKMKSKWSQADELFAQAELLNADQSPIRQGMIWPVQLHRAEIAARLGDRERQQQALDRAMASVSIFQKEGGMGHLEVSLWRQCMTEHSATNAVAVLAKELGPEHHRVKALARCWD